MNINKEQWETLNDITVQLYRLSDEVGSAKLEIFADKIRGIIGYDCPDDIVHADNLIEGNEYRVIGKNIEGVMLNMKMKYKGKLGTTYLIFEHAEREYIFNRFDCEDYRGLLKIYEP